MSRPLASAQSKKGGSSTSKSLIRNSMNTYSHLNMIQRPIESKPSPMDSPTSNNLDISALSQDSSIYNNKHNEELKIILEVEEFLLHARDDLLGIMKPMTILISIADKSLIGTSRRFHTDNENNIYFVFDEKYVVDTSLDIQNINVSIKLQNAESQTFGEFNSPLANVPKNSTHTWVAVSDTSNCTIGQIKIKLSFRIEDFFDDSASEHTELEPATPSPMPTSNIPRPYSVISRQKQTSLSPLMSPEIYTPIPQSQETQEGYRHCTPDSANATDNFDLHNIYLRSDEKSEGGGGTINSVEDKDCNVLLFGYNPAVKINNKNVSKTIGSKLCDGSRYSLEICEFKMQSTQSKLIRRVDLAIDISKKQSYTTSDRFSTFNHRAVAHFDKKIYVNKTNIKFWTDVHFENGQSIGVVNLNLNLSSLSKIVIPHWLPVFNSKKVLIGELSIKVSRYSESNEDFGDDNASVGSQVSQSTDASGTYGIISPLQVGTSSTVSTANNVYMDILSADNMPNELTSSKMSHSNAAILKGLPHPSTSSTTDGNSEIAKEVPIVSNDKQDWKHALKIAFVYMCFLLFSIYYGKCIAGLQVPESNNVNTGNSSVIPTVLAPEGVFIQHDHSTLKIKRRSILAGRKHHGIQVQLLDTSDELCLSWRHEFFGGRGIFDSCQLHSSWWTAILSNDGDALDLRHTVTGRCLCPDSCSTPERGSPAAKLVLQECAKCSCKPGRGRIENRWHLDGQSGLLTYGYNSLENSSNVLCLARSHDIAKFTSIGSLAQADGSRHTQRPALMAVATHVSATTLTGDIYFRLDIFTDLKKEDNIEL